MQVTTRLSNYNDDYCADTLNICGILAIFHRSRLRCPPRCLILIHNSLDYLMIDIDVAAADPRHTVTAHYIDKEFIVNNFEDRVYYNMEPNNTNGKMRDNGPL